MRNICLAFTAFITTATAAYSTDQTHELKFKVGTSSATLSGHLKGYDTMNYFLGANSGQAMSVLFSPKNASCYFNVLRRARTRRCSSARSKEAIFHEFARKRQVQSPGLPDAESRAAQ